MTAAILNLQRDRGSRKGARMERLTERTTDGILVKENHGENALRTFYQCFGGKPNANYSNCEEGYCAMEKLADYEDAEEQGLLLRLPCKVGTEVYNITWWDDVQEKVVVKGKTYCRTVHKHKVTKSTFSYFDIDEFGKTIFLTKEEAEAKLKEMEGAE
jgi:hypothetical protein